MKKFRINTHNNGHKYEKVHPLLIILFSKFENEYFWILTVEEFEFDWNVEILLF